MRKNVLMVMLLFSLTLVSANAQNGGLYVFAGGTFKSMNESTKLPSIGLEQSSKAVAKQLECSASLGLGYLFSPANDGQGVSVEVGASLGKSKEEYKNITSKTDSEIKMYGMGTSLGYNKKLLPNIYYVPQITFAYHYSTSNSYDAISGKWVEGKTVRSYGYSLSPFCVEYRSDNGFGLGMSFGGIAYMRLKQEGVDEPIHGWTFDFNTFGVSFIYYL